MQALETARIMLGINETSGLLIDRLKVVVEMAEAYVHEMTDMTDERYNELSEDRKNFYTMTISSVAQYFWNTSAKNGFQSQTDGITNTVYLTDLPDNIRKMINRFRCRI